MLWTSLLSSKSASTNKSVLYIDALLWIILFPVWRTCTKNWSQTLKVLSTLDTEIWLDGPNKVLFQNQSVCNTKELSDKPNVFFICGQVCYCSTLCWQFKRTRLTPTKTKAGRPSQTLWCIGSATTWKASSSCYGDHMLRRKELQLIGWVYTILIKILWNNAFTYYVLLNLTFCTWGL